MFSYYKKQNSSCYRQYFAGEERRRNRHATTAHPFFLKLQSKELSEFSGTILAFRKFDSFLYGIRILQLDERFEETFCSLLAGTCDDPVHGDHFTCRDLLIHTDVAVLVSPTVHRMFECKVTDYVPDVLAVHIISSVIQYIMTGYLPDEIIVIPEFPFTVNMRENPIGV